MKLYIAKNEGAVGKRIALDDMILTKDLPTAAGSRMLDGYMSLFDATVVEKAMAAGYAIDGKLNVGEFGIDLMGETSYYGAIATDGHLVSAAAAAIEDGATAVLSLDVNGAPRRAAAQSGTVCVKPTYGTVSRFGTVPAACSGECVAVTAGTAADCEALLDVVAGYDAKDGTSLPDALRGEAKPIRRVAVLTALTDGVDAETVARIEAAKAALSKNGIEVAKIDGGELIAARVAWNILMSAELCNNVSRYDGIKYGYRTPSYKTIDELYTNSRTEAFGAFLKTVILFVSETLSTDNYMKVYDKALRVRRVLVEYFKSLFETVDAVLLPACSTCAYEENVDPELAFTENLYTAPASVTGLPAVVFGGVQLIGDAFSDKALLQLADLCEKEGK